MAICISMIFRGFQATNAPNAIAITTTVSRKQYEHIIPLEQKHFANKFGNEQFTYSPSAS